MYSLSWTNLLKLEPGDRVLHHSGCFAKVLRVSSSHYEDGIVEMQIENGSPEMLLLNYRDQLEHHIFFSWYLGYQVPKFRAGDTVWCRGDVPGSSHKIDSVSPNGRNGFFYYLTDSQKRHPENLLVRASLMADG